MSNRRRALLLSLPALLVAATALAAPNGDPVSAAPGVSSPAPDHAAMPAGCNGCAGHDCANCPLAFAAAAQAHPALAPEIRCGAD